MVDSNKIASAINGYKQYFPKHWKDEKYKWEAIKHFQDNWDIDAPGFGKMFERATSKAKNLLTSGNVYPAGMILEFAKADESAAREMIRKLFDESLDLAERITAFGERSEELRRQYGNGEWKNHYQSINYIRYNHSHRERSYVEYDSFELNRPENRLIKSTAALLY